MIPKQMDMDLYINKMIFHKLRPSYSNTAEPLENVSKPRT